MMAAQWQIYVAIALRRLPVIVPKAHPIEKKVSEIFFEYEVAKSKLSAFEAEKLQELNGTEEKNSDILLTDTTKDREDRWHNEGLTYTPAPYDDRQSKVKYLFKKQKFVTEKEQLLLPQALFNQETDKNLLETARRALGHINKCTIFGIPSSVYSIRYNKDLKTDKTYVGAKVFFLKANIENDMEADSDVMKWMTIEEASDKVDKKYLRSIRRGLVDR